MGKELLDKFRQTGPLPSPPGTVAKLLTLCQDEEISLADLIDTVAADPALSLRLLKYANSELAGSPEPITTVRDAVLCLGVRSVRLMALNFSLISSREKIACPAFDYERFWQHSVTCAVASRHLARRTKNVSPDEAFTAGLLARIGKMVFAACKPAEYAEILNLSGGVTGPTAPLEEQCFQTSYADLSAELIEDWGIPQRLAQVVRFHKRPADLTDNADLQRFAAIVGTADLIADIVAWADSETHLARHCEALVGTEFFTEIDQAKAAVDAIRREASELASIMLLNRGSEPDAGNLKREAARLRGELSMATQLRATMDEAKTNKHNRAEVRPLPTMADRNALNVELTRQIRTASATGSPITLSLVAVDHFEEILETHGPQAGEAALRTVEDILQRQLRSVDFVAHLVPSIFAVLLTGPNHVNAAQICVRIRRAVELAGADGCPPITVSIGAAQWNPAEEEPNTEIITEWALQEVARSWAKGGNACSMKRHGSAKAQSIGPGQTGQMKNEQTVIRN